MSYMHLNGIGSMFKGMNKRREVVPAVGSLYVTVKDSTMPVLKLSPASNPYAIRFMPMVAGLSGLGIAYLARDRSMSDRERDRKTYELDDGWNLFFDRTWKASKG